MSRHPPGLSVEGDGGDPDPLHKKGELRKAGGTGTYYETGTNFIE